MLLCNNPGLMTLDGTNTWVLRGPGSDEMVIVDPGPDDDEHIARIAELGKIPLVLISHKHEDHTGGIDKIVERTGAPVRAVGSGFLRGLGGPLTDGEVIDAAGLRITVMATPGHTADSLSFRARRRRADRRHRARPRHHRHRQRGRQPRRLPGVAAAAARPGPPRGAARARPRSRRPRGGDAPCTWRTARSDSIRCATRCGRSATTPPRGRSSNTSTPTSTKSCGTPPNGRSRPSWTTSRHLTPKRTIRRKSARRRRQCVDLGGMRSATARGGPAARSRRSARSCPPGESSRGGRSRRAPC